jgi:hypothetical protein
MIRFRQKKLSILIYILPFVLLVAKAFLSQVFAADLTEAAMRLDRMAASTSDVDILVVVKPATTDTEDEAYLTFHADFTVDASPANITASTANMPSTFNGEALTAMVGLGETAEAVSSQNVTFDIGELTVGTLYGFFITAGLDNPASTGTKVNTISTRTSGSSVIDSKKVAVDIVSGSTDQITVGASVPATFNFALDGNSVTFGELASGSVSVGSTVNADIDTNASTGWVAWLSSANAALDSTATGSTIPTAGTVDDSPTTVTAGSDFYQLDVEVTNGTGDGTPSIDSEYDGQHGDPYEGGTFSTTLEEIARSDGPGTDDALALYGIAAMTALKEAATDYTDTWTVVGAGNF